MVAVCFFVANMWQMICNDEQLWAQTFCSRETCAKMTALCFGCSADNKCRDDFGLSQMLLGAENRDEWDRRDCFPLQSTNLKLNADRRGAPCPENQIAKIVDGQC